MKIEQEVAVIKGGQEVVIMIELCNNVEDLESYNRLEFKHKDYDCLVVKNVMGFLCGYVGITKESKFYGMGYDDINDNDIHGNLTFSDYGDGFKDTFWHRPIHNNKGEELYWIGFDMGHYNDYDHVTGKYKVDYKRCIETIKDIVNDLQK